MIALISDIHSNIDALEVVLADIRKLGVKTTLCLGDIVGYGPEPVECLRAVRKHCLASVIGNHEAMLFMLREDPEMDFGSTVGTPLKLAQSQMDQKEWEWLESLPLGIDLAVFEIIHSSFHNLGEFPYIDSTKTAKASFSAQKLPVSFHGHTHVPVIWEEKPNGKILCYRPEGESVTLDSSLRYAINPGSVGQPRDEDPRAKYVIFDPSNNSVLHRFLPYDLAKARERFRKAKLPTFNSARLSQGR